MGAASTDAKLSSRNADDIEVTFLKLFYYPLFEDNKVYEYTPSPDAKDEVTFEFTLKKFPDVSAELKINITQNTSKQQT